MQCLYLQQPLGVRRPLGTSVRSPRLLRTGSPRSGSNYMPTRHVFGHRSGYLSRISLSTERTAIADDYQWSDAMVVNHDGPPDNTRCPTCHMYKRLCDCDCDVVAEH